MIAVDIEGDREIKRALTELAPREARNVLRRTTLAATRKLRDDARRRAPKDQGVLRRAIRAKRDRGRPGSIEASVIITHGGDARFDAFYWRFLEYGTQKQSARPFMQPTFEAGKRETFRHFRNEFFPQFKREIEKRGAR